MVPKVRSIMTEKVYRIGPAATISMAAKMMADMKIGSLLVESQQQIVGIVTETDFTRKILAVGLDPNSAKVEEVMSSPVFFIDAEASVIDANQKMEKNNIRHLGVSENGKVVGILSVRDLLHPIHVGDKR